MSNKVPATALPQHSPAPPGEMWNLRASINADF